MKKNTEAVLRAFHANSTKGHPGVSIWTDGNAVWSYHTCILAWKEGLGMVLNRTRYSPTTTIHQNAIAADLRNYREVDDLKRGVTPEEVITRAEEKEVQNLSPT